MKIIGHRGAAGLALENTADSLKRAIAAGVDGVEFDVRLTKDRQLVLCHDKHLKRVAGQKLKVADLTLKELRQVTLKNGETLITLGEALKIVKGTVAYIEPKVGDLVPELLEAISQTPGDQIVITTFNHKLGLELERLRPDVTVYLAEHFRPLEVLHFIRHAKADGLTLNAWLLNPLTYWMTLNRGLKLMVYTINSPTIYWFIKKFYPKTEVCTDHPERFIRNGKAKD